MKKETKEKTVNDVQVKITPEIRALFDSYHKETEKGMTRYIGALSEDFQSKVSAIGEQFSGLNDKLDEHGRILEMHTEMIGSLMEDVAVLKEDVSVLKEDVAILKDDVSVLKEDVSVIKGELKNKTDKNETLHLVHRLSVLEHNV